MIINGMKAEMKFDFILYFQNKSVVLSDFIMFSFLYFAFIYLETGSSLADVYGIESVYTKTLFVVGYVIWMLSSRALTCISGELSYEASQGLLFSKITSIVPIELLYLAKFISGILCQIVIFIPVIIISSLIYPSPSIPIVNLLFIIVLVTISLLGMYGIGLFLASFTMSNRRLSRISFLLSTMLLFSTNALTYSKNLDTFLHYFPANYAINSARLIIANKSIDAISFIIFCTICIFLLIIGTFVFRLSEKQAMKTGKILWY